MDMDKRKEEEDDRPRRWRRPSRTQAFWIGSLLVVIFAAQFFDTRSKGCRHDNFRDVSELA